MGTYESRGVRPKKRNDASVRPHFLEDKLIAALFVHHRNLMPRELEARLLPMVLPRDPVKVWRDKGKRKMPSVICLPDLRGAPLPGTPRLPPRRKATQIIRDICESRNISLSEFLGDSRLIKIVRARQEACFLIAQETDMSLPAIGRFIKKDHSTVMHAINRYCAILGVEHPRRRQRETRYYRESVQGKSLPEMAE